MSSPVYNVSVDGNSNETDLVIQSAGASIVEHGNSLILEERVSTLEKKTEHEIKTINPVLNKNNLELWQIGEDLEPPVLPSDEQLEAGYSNTSNIKGAGTGGYWSKWGRNNLNFGKNVALSSDGTIAMVSNAPVTGNHTFKDSSLNNVVTYKLTDNKWVQNGVINKANVTIPELYEGYEYFLSQNVCMSGDGKTIAIPIIYSATPGSGDAPGRLHILIFKYTNNEWNYFDAYQEPEEYYPFDSQAWMLNINEDGSVIAQGADYNQYFAEFKGLVEIIQLDSNTNKYVRNHVFLGTDIASIPENEKTIIGLEAPGGPTTHISPDGNYVLFAADYDNTLVFSRNNSENKWLQVGNTISSAEEGFPYAVKNGSINSTGNKLVVANNTGSSLNTIAYELKNNVWVKMGNVITNVVPNKFSGTGRSEWSFCHITHNEQLGKDIVYVNCVTSGEFKMYELVNNEWVQLGHSIYRENGERNDTFTFLNNGPFDFKVTPDGNHVIVGYPGNLNEDGQRVGSARVFKLTDKSKLKINTDVVTQDIFSNNLNVNNNIYVDNNLTVTSAIVVGKDRLNVEKELLNVEKELENPTINKSLINPVLNKDNFNYFQAGQDLDPLPIGGAKYEEAIKLYKTTGDARQLLQYGFCTKISDDGNTILVQAGDNRLLTEVLNDERGINVYKWDDNSSMWLQKGQKIDNTFVGLTGKNAAGEDMDIVFQNGWLSVLSGDGNTICVASTYNKLASVNEKDNTRLYFFKYDETTEKWVAKGETYLEPERYTPYYSQGWNLRISFDGNKVLNSADYGLRDNITDPGYQGGYNELLAYNSTTNKWEIEHLFIGFEVPNLANDLGINENQITVVNSGEVGGIGPGVDANIETIVICAGYYAHYIYKKIDDLWTKTYTSSYKGFWVYGDLNSDGTKALIITGSAGPYALCDVVNWNSSTNSWEQEQTINLGSKASGMQAYITDNNLIVYSDKTNGTLKTWKYDENTKQWNLLTTKQVRETGYDGLQRSWFSGAFNTFKPSRNGKRVIIGFPFNTNPNGQINGHARVFELEDKSNLSINTNVITDELYAKKNVYIDNALGVRGNGHIFGDLFLGSTATTSLTRKLAQLDTAIANITTLQNQVSALYIEKPTLAEYLTQNVPFIVEFIAQNDAKFLTSIIGAKNYTFLLPNITENEFNALVQSSNPQYVISVLKSHLLLDYIFDRESDYGLHSLLNDFDFRLWNNISASIQNRNSSIQIDLSSNGFKIITFDEKIETNTENILEKNILTTNNIIQKIDKILLPQKNKLEIIQTYNPEFYQLIIDNNLQNDFNNAKTVICLAEGIADVIDSSFVAQLTANNITVADYMKLYCLTTFEKVDTWVSKLTYNTPLDDDNLEWLSGEPLPVLSDLSGIDAKYGLNVYGEIAYCYRDQSIINANYTNNNDGTYTYNTTGEIVNYREMFWRPPLGRQSGLLATDGIVHFTSGIIKPDIVRTAGVEPWMD